MPKNFSEKFRQQDNSLYSNSKKAGSYSQAFGLEPEETEESSKIEKTSESIQDKSKPQDLISEIRAYHKDILTSNPPRLSKKAEEILASNYRYLVIAEGNLKATVSDAKSLYITSCFPKEGKTTASVSLAYSLAVFSNRRVLLIDAHLEHPTIHITFNLTKGFSFMAILSNPSYLIRGIFPTFYENLFILPNISNQKIPDLSITTDMIKTFIKKVSPGFDYIIFDGSSILSNPEPTFFAPVVDAVIFVVECERTKWEVLQAPVGKLMNIKAKIGGVILNKRKFYIPPAIYKVL